VTTLLSDPEWAAWSDREIARRCAVHHVFVGDLRRSLVTVTSDASVRTVPTKHGTTTQMNTANIGRRTGAMPFLSGPETETPRRRLATGAVNHSAVVD
jgi:hypothetical protein